MPARARPRPGIARSALSKQAVVLIGVAVIVLLVSTSGYLLVVLQPGHAGTSTQSSPSGVGSGPGSTPDNPVSALALYGDYNLGGNATDYPRFTNHFVYARGNLTSIVLDPNTKVVETQLATGADLFEYWDWQNGSALPVFADEQGVEARCFVKGLVPSQNGTAYLYLSDCSLVAIQGSNAGT